VSRGSKLSLSVANHTIKFKQMKPQSTPWITSINPQNLPKSEDFDGREKYEDVCTI